MRVGIAGAGLLGRLLAWALAEAGDEVDVYDPAPGPESRFDGRGAAAFTAAGMLSPLAELDASEPEIAALGLRSLDLWQAICARLPERPFFARKGSLLVAHRADLGAAQRILARLEHGRAAMPAATLPAPVALDRDGLRTLEPALHVEGHAWHLPGEGQIDPVQALHALHAAAPTVRWHWGHRVEVVAAGAIRLEDGTERRFDRVFDVRGVGARPDLPVRGVRGEVVWLSVPGHDLTRPVRLLHPRHRVYLVPRPGDFIVVGASEIESEDRSPVSLRTAVELMAAAHSVLPALAEARIALLDVNLRPALPDNRPRIDTEDGLVRINGLYRHGWLLAPALVEQAGVALVANRGGA